MRKLAILLILLTFTACMESGGPNPTNPPDGGIGGTGAPAE